MARVLCAWEYGGDLGHVQRLTSLARALREAGHDPALAFSSLQHAAATSAGYRCYQAPLTVQAARPDFSPANLSHVLLQLGFQDPSGLEAPVRAWLSILALEKPDVLVADYAPVSLLAARIAGVPAVTIGSGFSSPPRVSPLPALRTWTATPEEQLRAHDEAATAAANRALSALGGTPLENAAQLFAGRDDILCTYPELDPFGPREGAEYLGPLDDAMPGAEETWPDDHRPRILAYLKPRYPGFGKVVAAIQASGASALVVAPGLRPADVQALSSPRVRVIPRAITLAPVLAACDLCVGHAGLGFTAKALSAGVPLAMLPMHLEQLLMAQHAQALGAGTFHKPPAPGSPAIDYAAWIAGLLADPAIRAAAQEQRARFARFTPRVSAARAAERVVAALES